VTAVREQFKRHCWSGESPPLSCAVDEGIETRKRLVARAVNRLSLIAIIEEERERRENRENDASKVGESRREQKRTLGLAPRVDPFK
jgi:hypothetical protein